MRATVRTSRKLGRNLPTQDYLKEPCPSGELSIGDWRDPELSRNVMRARLTDAKGADLLADLTDVCILSFSGKEMRLRGSERIDKVTYAQTWVVEFIEC